MLEIKLMFRQGKKLKQIAKEMGCSINTVRKYARDDSRANIYSPRPSKESKLNEYINYLKKRIEQAEPEWIPATVLYNEIKLEGYTGSLSLLRNYLEKIKPKIPKRIHIRFETNPGEQMQVDFAYFKFGNQKFYAFATILGYSRMLYIEFVKDQTVDTVIKCHENAFNYYNGVPKYGLYDNMKSVIITRDAYGNGNHKLQSCFYYFSKHYGIIPRFCKPYSPQTKGKIERMISYLRYSFYLPFVSDKQDITLEQLNNEVMYWLNNTANKRVHATTKVIPIESWNIEKSYLQPIPINYTTNYGVTNKIPTYQNIKDIIDKSNVRLQHELDIYDSLLQEGVVA